MSINFKENLLKNGTLKTIAKPKINSAKSRLDKIRGFLSSNPTEQLKDVCFVSSNSLNRGNTASEDKLVLIRTKPVSSTVTTTKPRSRTVKKIVKPHLLTVSPAVTRSITRKRKRSEDDFKDEEIYPKRRIQVKLPYKSTSVAPIPEPTTSATTSNKPSLNDRLHKIRTEALLSQENNNFTSISVTEAKQVPNFNDNNEMEWELCTASDVQNEVSNIRTNAVEQISEPSTSNTFFSIAPQINVGDCDSLEFNLNNSQSSINESKLDNENRKPIYIIFDTNVVVRNLVLLKKVIQYEGRNKKYPIVYLPYTVIKELDILKSRTSPIRILASSAIKFLSTYLETFSERIRGQTAIDHATMKNLIEVDSPDDEILNCCLQLQKTKRVILVSDDVNLRNKGFVSGITVNSSDTFENRLKLQSIFG